MSFLLMISTVGSEKEAQKIAKTLVQGKLAACVNIIPGIKSYYIWEEKLCQEKETLLLLKTASQKSTAIIRQMKKIHSYEVPEIIFMPITKGEKKYMQWLKKMTGGNPVKIKK